MQKGKPDITLTDGLFYKKDKASLALVQNSVKFSCFLQLSLTKVARFYTLKIEMYGFSKVAGNI